MTSFCQTWLKILQPALGRVLEELGAFPAADEKVELECQGSSIGIYSGGDKDWLKSFRRVIPGNVPDPKILFPTLASVDASIAGRQGAISWLYVVRATSSASN